MHSARPSMVQPSEVSTGVEYSIEVCWDDGPKRRLYIVDATTGELKRARSQYVVIFSEASRRYFQVLVLILNSVHSQPSGRSLCITRRIANKILSTSNMFPVLHATEPLPELRRLDVVRSAR